MLLSRISISRIIDLQESYKFTLNLEFLSFKSDLIVKTPFLFMKGGRVWVFKIFQKMGGSDVFHKKGGVAKIGGCFMKGLSLLFILTNPFQCYYSLSVCCVSVWQGQFFNQNDWFGDILVSDGYISQKYFKNSKILKNSQNL